MTPDGRRLARTLEWIVRLPLCGDAELAGLLGIDPIDARRLLHELTTRGCVESIVPGSPELELRRLACVRDEALHTLAAALGLAPVDVPRRAPVRIRDTLDRVSRVEITAGVNRFLGDLAADLRRSGVAQLADARSLPLAVPARERWWLPATEAYGCLRAGELWAPFLVAWDRAAAPDLYRRRRVAAWSAASTAVGTRWGAEGVPPILVVCPSPRELRVWEQALLRRGEGGAVDRLEVLLTTRDELQTHGPSGAVWQAPDRNETVVLAEWLGWGQAPPVPPVRLPDRLDGLPEQPSRVAPSIRELASTPASANAAAPIWQRVAVLALATSAEEKRLVEWVARHPLLSASELGALLDESEALIERRLEWLARCGAVRAEAAATTGEHGDERDQRMSAGMPARYVLTELGMRSFAPRAGVPPPTFARHGGVTFLRDASGGTRMLRHRAHTIGVNRFFAQLATDARRAGWRLDEWRNEAESTRRFVDSDGRTSWIRPDGSGVLLRGAESRSFLLEYDRGTLDAGDYRPKFDAYQRYYSRQEWRSDFNEEPVLLFVCSDERAARRVVLAGGRLAGGLPLRLTTERRAADARWSGPSDDVWWGGFRGPSGVTVLPAADERVAGASTLGPA